MKEGIHPNYREVCFQDMSNGFKFVTRSCVNAKEMIKMEDGRELPLFKLDTTSESHPFYTGHQKAVGNFGCLGGPLRKRFRKNAGQLGSVFPPQSNPGGRAAFLFVFNP